MKFNNGKEYQVGERCPKVKKAFKDWTTHREKVIIRELVDKSTYIKKWSHRNCIQKGAKNACSNERETDDPRKNSSDNKMKDVCHMTCRSCK